MELRTLSPWLSDYQWYGSLDCLEIPGQYQNCKSKPNLDRHVKIVKIHHNLLAFASIRRPLRITFLGSDGLEHNFVIKYGEDLRQDERIQQILCVMHNKLAMNSSCRAQGLGIVTYSVTPISEIAGLLKWVPNTKPLKGIMKTTFERQTKKSFETEIVRKIHGNVVQRIPDASYMNYATHANQGRSVLERFYQMVENNTGVNTDILKWGLMDIALTSECYFVLRNNFAKSLAAMNIANWILGIGDRHLDK